MKLIDQVNYKMPVHGHMEHMMSAPTTSGQPELSGCHFLMPQTPDPNTPFMMGASESTAPACPRARAGPAPPQTMLSVLQVRGRDITMV